MIEILSHNAPILTVRIIHENRDVRVDVGMVLHVNDLLLESLDGSVSRHGIAEGLRDWLYLNHLNMLSLTECKTTGVSLYDVVVAAGADEDEKSAKQAVARFSKSKKITAKPIGQCPGDARKSLYRLFEILADYENYCPIPQNEKRRIEAILKQKEREPK